MSAEVKKVVQKARPCVLLLYEAFLKTPALEEDYTQYTQTKSRRDRVRLRDRAKSLMSFSKEPCPG